MIYAATNCISRNALHSRPGIAISRRTHHDIVRATATFKSTVLPGDIDFAGAIYLSGWKWLSAYADYLVIGLSCD